ncbi:MAG: hypothetical protein NWF01_10545 [Candidatus Bathyarchaeota archaeon]|nr:hypothetical protein [Candidatus Bathyarchaeota archaeon]
MSESKILTTMGLSNYEANAYSALLYNGVTTAEKISTSTKIPNGRIYDVLDSLVKKGLINVQKSRPKLFVAVEPQIALKRLLEAKKTDLDREYSHMLLLASVAENQLKNKLAPASKPSMFWTVVVGKKEVMQLLERTIDEAKEEVLFYGANLQAQLPELASLVEALAQKYVKGSAVSFKFLFGLSDISVISQILGEKSFSELIRSNEVTAQIRFIEDSPLCYDVIDGERVLIKIANPLNPSEYFAAISVWDKNLAVELKKKFEVLWLNGKQLDINAIEQLSSTDTPFQLR